MSVPANVLRMYPNVSPDTWMVLSQHRFRAEHPNGALVLVVSAFGETVGQGCPPALETQVFARLIESCATTAAHRLSCEQGTPLVRPDAEANHGVVGCCWWCGALPKQHTAGAGESL